MKKKGGPGRKVEFTPMAFGGAEEEKQPARTVVEETILSPEGASIKDLCIYNEDCQIDICKFYHPHWAVKICIAFAGERCKNGKACKK